MLNVVGWALLATAVGHHFHVSQTKLFGLGTGVLAYTLGMRHAFDADHIAAIDNTTRKLVGEGKRPLGVGFLLLAGPLERRAAAGRRCSNFGIRRSTSRSASQSSGLHSATTIVGTSISGTFLYLIAL